MTRFSAHAKKYLFCLAGIGFLIGMQHLGIEIPGLPDIVRDLFAGVLISEGVYQLRNAGGEQ